MGGCSKKAAKVLLALSLAAALPLTSHASAAKIVLDAGHGGSDPGAVGTNGLYEKTVNLDVVLKLRDVLEEQGHEVVLTRSNDQYLSLSERVAITEASKPDLFVSVHANSHTNSAIRGSLVLYYDNQYPQADYPASEAMSLLTPESKKLAQLVQAGMVEAAGTEDKGIVPSAVYVTRMGSVPSVLAETAFLSNSQDAALLSDSSFRYKLAAGIASGIDAYLDTRGGQQTGIFSDVPISHWAYEAIEKLQENGIVEGEYGKYYPERPLTRAEFVAMLERQFPFPDEGVSDPAESAGSLSVTQATYGSGSVNNDGTMELATDLTAGHWAYSVMMKAVSSGVLDGFPDGTLRPDQALTRGEAAVLIDRILWPGSSQTAAKTMFRDVPKSLWSAASINRLKEKGIVEGVTSTSFMPERAITRAEMAALLARLLQ